MRRNSFSKSRKPGLGSLKLLWGKVQATGRSGASHFYLLSHLFLRETGLGRGDFPRGGDGLGKKKREREWTRATPGTMPGRHGVEIHKSKASQNKRAIQNFTGRQKVQRKQLKRNGHGPRPRGGKRNFSAPNSKSLQRRKNNRQMKKNGRPPKSSSPKNWLLLNHRLVNALRLQEPRIPKLTREGRG